MASNGYIALLFLICPILINLSFANPQLSSFLPKNDKRISVFDKNVSSISEAEFEQVLEKFEKIYSPIVEQHQRHLLFHKKWPSDKVNAHTYRTYNKWVITIFGGLVRHPKMTKDALALIICHEFGHQLGGLPKKNSLFSLDWASAEGQADYFASLKCIRKYFADDDNISIVSKMTIDPVVSSKCRESFGRPEEIAICQRSAMSGYTSISMMDDVVDNSTPSSFATPSTKVVTRTIINKYPDHQCRLDTYLAGALCLKSAYEDVSETDINLGICTREEGLDIGARPTCWYKP